MKRMYVLLGVMLLITVWAVTGFGQKQDSRDQDLERIRRHMELREELHRKMLDNLFHGTHDDSLFRDMDKLFEDAMKDSLGSSSFRYSIGGQSVETEWQESASGRTLLITPKSKDQKLDINIEGEMVTIRGKNELKTQNGVSVSDFSNSFSVPQDCDSSKVKMDQKDGKIVVFFPWRSERKPAPKTDGRIPLPKSDSDVSI